MILIGQYDSPYVRRVAISLRVLGFEYEHDTRSVFADFDAMREINLEDELVVLNGIVLRLEGREVETTGLKAISTGTSAGLPS
jgi:hypothetical protein